MLNEELELRRREFLRLAGGSAFMSVAVGAGLAGFSSAAWSAHHLKALSETEGRALLAMARTLFPHDFLADAFYGNVVNNVDGRADASAETKKLVTDGIARMEKLAAQNFNGAGFAQLPEKSRVRILKAIEKSPFFSYMYGETLGGLYGNSEVWKIFGYEGSSVEKGGYIERGFDDISWLPKD